MKRKPGVRANERKQSSAETGFGRQMNEQHPGWAADCVGAIAAAADIVGEEHVASAAPVLLPVAVSTSSVPESRQEAGRLEAGCQSWYKPSGISVTVVLWVGNVAERRAVLPQAYTPRQGLEEKQKT